MMKHVKMIIGIVALIAVVAAGYCLYQRCYLRSADNVQVQGISQGTPRVNVHVPKP